MDILKKVTTESQPNYQKMAICVVIEYVFNWQLLHSILYFDLTIFALFSDLNSYSYILFYSSMTNFEQTYHARSICGERKSQHFVTNQNE